MVFCSYQVDHVWILEPGHYRELDDNEFINSFDETTEYSNVCVKEAVLMPASIDDTHWNTSFKLSDHRPVQVRLGFSTK